MPVKRRNIGASAAVRGTPLSSVVDTVDLSTYTPTETPMVNPTLRRLENDEEYQEDVEKYMAYIGSQDDGFLNEFLAGNLTTSDWKEFLRDEDWKLTSVIDRRRAIENAPEDVKQAYNRVRDKWDRAEVGNYAAWVDAIKDIGVDIVTDPINLGALLAIPFTSGGSAAAGVLAKEGAKQAAKTTLKRIAPTATGAAEGAVWSGVENYNRQNIEIATGLRNEFSDRDFNLSIGLGGSIGAGIGLGLGFLTNKMNAAKVERDIVPDNKALDNQVNNVAANEADVVDNISNGTLPKSPEVVEAVNDLVERLPIRSATFQNNSLIETRGMPTDFDIADFGDIDEIADRLAKELGGGETTTEELADLMRQAIAAAKRGNLTGDDLSDFVTARITRSTDEAAPGPTGTEAPDAQDFVSPTALEGAGGVAEPIRNKLLFNIGRLANKLNSTVIAGKATDLLSPYAKLSPTVRRLQSLFRYDSSLKLTSPTTDETLGRDYFEVLKETFGTFVTSFKRAYDPIILGTGGDVRQEMDDLIISALRGGVLPDDAPQAVKDIVPQLRKLFDDRAEALFMEEAPANYIPRMWKRSVIESNKSDFKRLLLSDGYESAEADSIIESMLRKSENVSVIDSGGSSDTIFLMPRVLDKISDDNLYKDFLENDLNKIVHEYGIQSARRIAKLNVLGVRNLKDFQEIWIPRIQDELAEAGLKGDPLIGKAVDDITKVYSSITGEGVQRYGNSVQTVADAYTMATRTATLPLATLSSLTEIFINISKAGFRNSFRGLSGAMGEGFDTIATKSKNLLADSGLTEPEIWREMQELGIAMDQAAGDVADRLGGEAIVNTKIRSINNAFFRANFLDQWTKFVQMTSYITGKNLITENIATIAANRGLKDSRRILNKKRQLMELGVDIDQGLAWFDNGMKADDAFNKNIQRAAGRYTNEVILNPEAASGLKPLLHSNPRTAILFQLLGYPAAFTNTVLKGALRGMIKDPQGNALNTLGAGIIMTEVARFNNWARTGGKSEEEGENPYGAAIMRWGGGGTYIDMFRRMDFAAEQAPVFAPVLGVSGPFVQDLVSLGRGYQGPVEFAARKTPGFGAFEAIFGKEFKDNYTMSAREIDKMLDSFFAAETETRVEFRKGGEVYDVPNASEEPDERVDRLTGIPYNEQAGGAFIDEEERQGFVTGQLAKPVRKFFTSALSEAVGKIADQGQNIPFSRLVKRLQLEGVRTDEIDASDIMNLVDEKDVVTTRSGNRAVTAEGLKNAEARRTDVFKQEESTYLQAQERIEEVAEDLQREVEMLAPQDQALMEAEYAENDEILAEAFSDEDFRNIENPDPTFSYANYLLDTAFNPEEPLAARKTAVEEIERVLDKAPSDFKDMYEEVVPEDAELNTYYIRYFSDPRVPRPTEGGHFAKGIDYSEDLNFVYWTRGDVASGDKTITGGEASRVYEIQSDSRVELDLEKLSPYQKLLFEAEVLDAKIGEIEDSILDVDLKLEEFNIIRSSTEDRAVIPPDAEEAVKTLIKRNNELMDELTAARKQERDLHPKLKDARKNLTATEARQQQREVDIEGTEVPINVWKNAIHNEIVKAKEQGLDEIQFLIDDKLVENRGVTEFMSRSPEIQKAYETIVAPLVIKTARKIGAKVQRKGKYIAFALPAAFTLPLYAEEDEELSELATDLSFGMEIDESLMANRELFSMGGTISNLINSAITKGANLLGFDDARQLSISADAADMTARIDPSKAITWYADGKKISTEELRNLSTTRGDIGILGDEELFDVVNHSLFGYESAEDPVTAFAGQVKEVGQGLSQAVKGKNFRTELKDMWNNSLGINLRKQGLNRTEFETALTQAIANTKERLAKGEKLRMGRDVIFNPNDLMRRR